MTCVCTAGQPVKAVALSNLQEERFCRIGVATDDMSAAVDATRRPREPREATMRMTALRLCEGRASRSGFPVAAWWRRQPGKPPWPCACVDPARFPSVDGAGKAASRRVPVTTVDRGVAFASHMEDPTFS
ncbi:hypothetical protein GCM10010271_00440 [Streptomyces kurssanovii]|nr:hypothetical protein GCM10010271_00440 [Streptomyces kurssanovii]